ncbi:MAG: sugar phosphate isomerase/epimerase family protein [Niabella sp.]
MYNRKDFIKLSSGAAIGLFLNSCAVSSASTGGSSIRNLGIQLYSLRDDLPKNPKEVLKQLAGFGYKEIESYEGNQGMFWGMGNTGFKAYMNELGMKMVSSHCNFKENLEKKAADAAAIDMEYLICPHVGKQKTLDDYKKIADSFNTASEICRKNGIRFAYHNHAYSFTVQDGKYPQDILMQNATHTNMDFEMDIYWVVAAGQDPISWFKKYPNRFRLSHVKDRTKGIPPKEGEENHSCIVGNGSIDFKSILKEGRKEGLQHYILEQEAYEKPPIACVKEGADYLTKLKF